MVQVKPNLHFRVATAADAPLIHPLVEAAYRGDESRAGWTTESHLLTGTRIAREDLLAKITAPDNTVLLAFDRLTVAEKPLLIACCEVTRLPDRVAYFGMFAVSPRRQGGGIGRQVLEYAEEYCRRTWGTEKMEIKVLVGRPELTAWYVRRGYRATGERLPFPMEELAKLGSVPLVEELAFEVMVKDLKSVKGVGNWEKTSGTPVQELGVGAAVDLVATPRGGED